MFERYRTIRRGCDGRAPRFGSDIRQLAALLALYRNCSNSIGYRKTSGFIEIMHDPGRSRRMEMFAVQGSAAPSMNKLRRLVEKNLDVRFLCLAGIYAS